MALHKRMMDAIKRSSLPAGDAGIGGVRPDEAGDPSWASE